MQDQRVSFCDSSGTIYSFLESQNVPLSESLYVELLRFLSKACMYEEEERKIRPSIVIGSNLLNKDFKKITQATIIPLVKEPLESSNLTKRLKSSLPFCNNGWRVFVNIDEQMLTYGIIRNFNGPSGLNVEDVLVNLTNEELTSLQTNFVLIDVISNFEIILRGYDGTCTIDFRLVDNTDNEDTRKLFLQDLLSAYSGDIAKETTAYSKIIKLFSQKLHGSICLVVKHDYTLPDEILKDGIFLETPIDIYSVLAEVLQDANFAISAHEKYHAFTGVLLEMLNIDGITVVDNMGRIRAYNVFVKPEATGNETLSGGARKRAATYLRNQSNPNYIGVYFQSQDGMNSYERIGIHE